MTKPVTFDAMTRDNLKPDNLIAIYLIDGSKITIDCYTTFRRIVGQINNLIFAKGDYLEIRKDLESHVYTWMVPVGNIVFYEFREEKRGEE